MKTVGIIAEYNPFHTGHEYHIEKSRQITGADCVVVVMSGDFVQRGTPAIADKYTRAEAALIGGADLVLELPVVYSTGSAEIFAMGAISILNSLGGIDYIAFGGETDSIEALNQMADILCIEPQEYRELLQKGLRKGLNMPVARKEALNTLLPEISTVINTPNNILGVEYLKALKTFHSNIQPIIIKRMGSGYHSEELSEDFASATALRECFNIEDFSSLDKFMPEQVFELYKSKHCSALPVFPEDIDMLLYYTLISEQNNLEKYLDINNNLANKINNVLKSGELLSFNELVMALKSKELTYTRISRALLHAVLGITNEDLLMAKDNNYPCYGRILGFNETGRKFLNNIRKNTNLSLISNLSENLERLTNAQKNLLQKDIFAANIYRNIVKTKFKTTLRDEYRSSPVNCGLVSHAVR